ncbi:hypothetical protein LTR17_013091 [Elasticomyces elasticus]|nr:hypothetical protein LTR17_013091 [Elasticomyces elasticus]
MRMLQISSRGQSAVTEKQVIHDAAEDFTEQKALVDGLVKDDGMSNVNADYAGAALLSEDFLGLTIETAPPILIQYCPPHRDASIDLDILRSEYGDRSLDTDGDEDTLRMLLRNNDKNASANAAGPSTLEVLDADLLKNWTATQVEYERTRTEVRRPLQLCKALQHHGEGVKVGADPEALPRVLNQEGLATIEEDAAASLDGIDEAALFDYDRMQTYLEDPECQYRSLHRALTTLRDRL